jgi:hypothetical protein
MDKVFLDSTVAGQLARTDQHVPLCGPDGHKLGYFVPAEQYDRELYNQAKALWSGTEVEELNKQDGGIETEELLRRLAKL